MKQLVAYITSKYPDSAFSVDLARTMGENGVDSIELGIPFSDPVADGPVIEKANYLALERGFKMADLEEMGLVAAPHTSAGRVPTAKGYRLFVDTLRNNFV